MCVNNDIFNCHYDIHTLNYSFPNYRLSMPIPNKKQIEQETPPVSSKNELKLCKTKE